MHDFHVVADRFYNFDVIDITGLNFLFEKFQFISSEIVINLGYDQYILIFALVSTLFKFLNCRLIFKSSDRIFAFSFAIRCFLALVYPLFLSIIINFYSVGKSQTKYLFFILCCISVILVYMATRVLYKMVFIAKYKHFVQTLTHNLNGNLESSVFVHVFFVMRRIF